MEQIPFPVAETRNLLGENQPFLVQAQFPGCPGGTEHVADPVTEDGRVEGFGDEIGGANLEGAMNHRRIVTAGHHQRRQVFTAGELPQGAAGGETVHPRQVDIEEHRRRRPGLELHQRRLAARRLDDAETGFLEGVAHDLAHPGVVIDNQDFLQIRLILHHDPPPKVDKPNARAAYPLPVLDTIHPQSVFAKHRRFFT